MFWFKTYELFIFSVIFWFMLQSCDTNYDAAFCCWKVIWICKKMPDVILLLIYRIRIMTFPWLAWDIHCLIGRKFVMTTISLHFAYEISKDEVLHEISVTVMKWMQWEAMGMFHLFSVTFIEITLNKAFLKMNYEVNILKFILIIWKKCFLLG